MLHSPEYLRDVARLEQLREEMNAVGRLIDATPADTAEGQARRLELLEELNARFRAASDAGAALEAADADRRRAIIRLRERTGARDTTAAAHAGELARARRFYLRLHAVIGYLRDFVVAGEGDQEQMARLRATVDVLQAIRDGTIPLDGEPAPPPVSTGLGRKIERFRKKRSSPD